MEKRNLTAKVFEIMQTIPKTKDDNNLLVCSFLATRCKNREQVEFIHSLFNDLWCSISSVISSKNLILKDIKQTKRSRWKPKKVLVVEDIDLPVESKKKWYEFWK